MSGYNRMQRGGMTIDNVNSKSDLDLIKAVAMHRNSEAFKTLFERHHLKAYNLTLRITRKPEMAEEAVQNGMLKIWLNCGMFDENKSNGTPISWIFSIFAREALQLLKSRRNEKRRIDAYQDIVHLVPDTDNQRTEKNENLVLLRKAIHDLSPQQQCMVTLYFGAGLKQKDIGLELDMPERTVSNKLKMALSQMRKSLTDAGLTTSLALIDTLLPEVILSGVRAPAGLWKGIEESLAESAGPDMTSTHSFYEKFSRLQVAMAGLLLAAIVTSATVMYRSASTARNDQNTTHTPPLPGEKSKRLLNKFWDFNTPGLDDLDAFKNAWTRLPSGGLKGSGCLTNATPSKMKLGLKVIRSDLPVRIQFNVKMEQKKFPVTFLRWGNVLPDAAIQTKLSAGTFSSRWVQFQCFIDQEVIGVWVEGKLVSLAMAPYQPSECLSMTFIQNWTVDNLEIRSIAPETMPDTRKYTEAAAKIPEDQRQYFHLLPRLTPTHAGHESAKLFRVVFSHAHPRVDLETKTQTWRFQKENEWRDFSVPSGRSVFIPKGGKNGTGCIEMQGVHFRTFFNCNLRKTPFMVTARFRARPKGKRYGYPALLWMNLNGDTANRVRSFPALKRDTSQPWVTVKYYVAKRYIDMWVGNRRADLKIRRINQYGMPYLYSSYRTQMDFLEIKSIEYEAFPKLGSLRREVDQAFADMYEIKHQDKNQ